jgi:DNA-binding LacI/PurR family transcriptional regulator
MGSSDTKVLGLLTDGFNAVFVREVLPGLETALMGRNVRLEIIEMEELTTPEKNRHIELLALEHRVDALVVCHLSFNARQAALFIESRIPVGILAGRLEGLDWCMVDEIQGAYEATRHLLAMGHRRLALVSGPPVALESRLREDGFLRALKEAGLKPGQDGAIKTVNFGENEGYEAGHLLMRLPNPPTGVFCSAGDITCLGLIAAFKEVGLRMPRDLSLVGYGGLGFTEHLDPPLTTVRQPLREMAQTLAIRVLNRLLEPGLHTPQGEMFEAHLLLRHSTAYPMDRQSGTKVLA